MEIQKTETEIKDEQYTSQIEELTEQLTEYKIRAEKSESLLKDDKSVVKMSNDEVEKMNADKLELQHTVEHKDGQIVGLKEALEKLEGVLKESEEKIQIIAIDLETANEERDMMKEEKEIIELELRQQDDDRKAAMMDNLREDEIRTQNEKLRIALRKLNDDFQVERALMEKDMNELRIRVAIIPEMEEKLGEMDLLLEEIDLRDAEIDRMTVIVEEAEEFEQMIDQLTEDLLAKEEEVEELLEKLIEQEELNAIQEEINAS